MWFSLKRWLKSALWRSHGRGLDRLNPHTSSETKSGHFEPEKFEDHYEDALKELLKKKQAGEKIEAPKERAPAKVINLMDALRRSVETERGGAAKRQAPSAKARGSDSERPKKKKSR